MKDLSITECRMLDYEAIWWRFADNKTLPIYAMFGMSRTRYYGLLDELVWTNEAYHYSPRVVNRLRILQERGRHPGASTQPAPKPRSRP